MSSAAPPPTPPPPPPAVGYAPPPPPPPPGGYVPGAAAAGPDFGSVFSKLDQQGIRPTIIVAAVVLGLYLGSQLLNAIIPVPGTGVGSAPGPAGPGPVQPGPVQPTPGQPGPIEPGQGQAVDIGPLRLTLPAGWDAGQTQNGNFRMVKGGVAVDLVVLDTQGDAAALYNTYVNQALAPDAQGFGATQPSAVPIAGTSAARGAYSGVFGSAGQIEGEVTTVVLRGKGYIFDAWGQLGTLGPLRQEVQRMLDTMQVTG